MTLSVGLSPVGNQQQYQDNNNNLLSGGYLAFYQAGAYSIYQNIYADNLGATPRSNPIQLSSSGRVPGTIWLDNSLTYNVVLYQADGTTVISNCDNITGISTPVGAATFSEWNSVGGTLAYVDAHTFTTTGNWLTSFPLARRVKAQVSAGTIYGYVTSVTFVTVTTVQVAWDTGSLDAGISAVSVGFLDSVNPSVPEQYHSQAYPIPATFASNVTISGTLTVGNATAITGTVSATSFSGAGTGLTGTAASLTAGVANSVAGSNVSGYVANATYATSAGSASTATNATTAATATNNVLIDFNSAFGVGMTLFVTYGVSGTNVGPTAALGTVAGSTLHISGTSLNVAQNPTLPGTWRNICGYQTKSSSASPTAYADTGVYQRIA